MGASEDDREATLSRRESEVDRREAALDQRLAATGEIVEAAELRDSEADLRDEVSAKRDHASDLAAFVHPNNGGSYGSDNPGRRHAALDRVHAKNDRASSAIDREALTQASNADPDETPEGGPARH